MLPDEREPLTDIELEDCEIDPTFLGDQSPQ